MGSRANEYAFEISTPSTATATTASSTVLAANTARRYAAICNTGAVDVYLAIGAAAVAGRGVLLKANGGSFELNANNLSHGAVNAITSSGSAVLSILEGQ